MKTYIYNVNDYDYTKVLETTGDYRNRPNRKKVKTLYKEVICAFDIETTGLSRIEQSFMYIWQFSILYLKEQTIDCIYGRTWEEFNEFIERLQMDGQETTYLTYVHNLSYEFQFLRGIHHFEANDVMLIKNRKVLKLNLDRFEFRCSYMQTNMSLETFTTKYNAEHSKLSGEDFDYSKLRYPWTPLTKRELEYCVNDVIGLVEAMYVRMIFEKDTLYSIPLTSTGYIRRICKNRMYAWAKTHKRIFPAIQVYDLLEQAFRGGDTHANRYYVGEIVENVHSADRSSSYPDCLCNCKFPVTQFKETVLEDIDDFYRKVSHNKALLFIVEFTNIRQKDIYYGAPYLSVSKCRELDGTVEDNGRVLLAKHLITTVTDVDFKIIDNEYEWDSIEFHKCFQSTYGDLPEQLKDCVREQYTNKTTLKGIEEKELFYNMAKALLNSIYGMMVQCPAKQNIEFIEDNKDLFQLKDDSRETLLSEYNARAFVPYQWGVWCTAWARYRLKEVINLTGDNFVYCDTDSVKYIYDEKIEKAIEEYNKTRYADSEKNNAYATDPQGVVHYMGVYENDGEYNQFETMGAKKYVYTDKKGLHATIAGVNKKKAPLELQKIENFKEGFKFTIAGGTESVYNDIDYGTYTVGNREIEITKNLYIKNSTYTLGYGKEYIELLKDIHLNYRFKQYLEEKY